MDTSTVTVINAEAIQGWIQQHLAPLCPDGAEISVIPRPQHCKGESAFFAAIDVDGAITPAQLLQRQATEHSRGQYLHFYVDDVVSAAVGAGDLTGNYFHVHYRW